MLEFLFHLARVFFLAQFVDQDLDARLVLVVAPAIAVVHEQARFRIGNHLIERQEFTDHRPDHRGAAHAAARIELRSQFPGGVLHQLDADIVQPHRRAVSLAGDYRDLELARQGQELGVEAGPLAQQLRIRAGVHHFVGRGSGILVGTDVADAVAAGLDRVHLHRGEIGQDVRRIFQLDPVVLDVLARGEVAIAAVILVRDIPQHRHLRRIQRAVRHRDAQHVGMQLKVKPVLQAQGAELLFRQAAVEAAAHLIAEFGDAGINHRLVILVVLVHQITQLPACGSEGFNVRSGRTVGPSARMRSLMWAGRTSPPFFSPSIT